MKTRTFIAFLLMMAGLQTVKAQHGMQVWQNGKFELYFINDVDSVRFVNLVTDIYLSQGELTINVGETSQLTATVYPIDADEHTVAWESSAPDIASVDGNGLVTAASPGTAVITATATDGSGVKAECQVTVTETVAPTDGLVAYYPFNGNANDESGNGNDGTVIGNVELTTDRFGNPNSAYRFPGEPFNYISVPDVESLHLSTFTLNAWVYTDGDDYGYGFLINKGRDINDVHKMITMETTPHT